MEKRPYNIFFHLHTVSGIIISVLLFVIFFAGSFSFFRDEIVNWERNEPVSVKKKIDLDIDVALDTLQKRFNLHGRDISFSRGYDERRVMVNVSASKDTLNKQEGSFFYLDTKTLKAYEYEPSYTLGEFLYRLHFFAQIPYPVGYYLSGFTALFLFFALLTGVLVHWKKIISNFFLFRPWAKLKTVWTDAHTVLGTIGLPFQAVYALTGAFFMIKIVLLLPNVMVLYNGDEKKLYDDLGYKQVVYPFEGEKLNEPVSISYFTDRTASTWKDFDITAVEIYNYGDMGMHISTTGELSNTVKFTGLGQLAYKASSKEIVVTKDPYQTTTYLDGVKNVLYRIHFGDYGGYALKVASFLMGILSCLVIISGILVWLEARKKTNIPERRRRFNKAVGHVYLAICLSMYPVTALSFIVTKLLSSDFFDVYRQTILYSVFFISWLLLSLFFWFKKDNYFTNKCCLLSGSIVGIFIPVVNGITTGNWIWQSWSNGLTDVFVVDALWISISATALVALYRMKKIGSVSEHESKHLNNLNSNRPAVRHSGKNRPVIKTQPTE